MTEQSQQAIQATGKENVGTLASIVVFTFFSIFLCVLYLRPLASPCKVAKQSSVLVTFSCHV